MAEDVTDVDSTQQLSTEAEMFRTLAEQSPIPLVLSDIQTGEILFTNSVTDDAFNHGVKPTGMGVLDFYEDPADRPKMLATLQKQGRLHGYPLRLRRSDGVVRDNMVYMQPTVIHGRPLLYTYILDVTEQKEAERILQTRTAEMALILNNVNDGLLMVDAAGRMSAERSAVVSRWLGESAPRETLWDYISRTDPSVAEWLELSWESLADGLLPLELCLEQLPTLIRCQDQFIQLRYTPITDADGALVQALVVMSDISEAVQREQAEADQRDLLALLDRMLRDPEGVRDFVVEASAQAARLSDPLPEDVAKRLIHTLKGNTALFGLSALSARCHALESSAVERGELDRAELDALIETWGRLERRIRSFLSVQSSDAIVLHPEDLDGLQAAIASGVPAGELFKRVSSWRVPPLSRRLSRLADQIRTLARKLERSPVEVSTADHGLRLKPARWAPFWSAFTHAIRNALDHGLEPAAEREAAGKPPGQIGLEVAEADGWITVSLSDNGRGIDWERIRAKAAERGIPHQSQEDLEAALFADGLSSRDEATTLSGRGVGMGALRAITEEMGGRISIETAAGEGTTFRFHIPAEAT